MFDIQLNAPSALALLFILVPALAALLYFNHAARRQGRLAFGETHLVSRHSSPITFSRERFAAARWLAILVLLVIALAQPSAPGLPSTTREGSLQVVAVIDVSASMATEAYREQMTALYGEPDPGAYGHNLDMAKAMLIDQMLPAIAGNELGIITYRGDGLPRWELTDDLSTAEWVLTHWIDLGEAPMEGSNYTAGLRRAIEMFDRSESPTTDQVIVLFADGGFSGDAAELSQVLQEIRERGIRLIVVGMGPQQPSRIPTYDRYGRQAGWLIIRDEVQWIVVDEGTLRNLAGAVDGEYIRVYPGEYPDIAWATALTSGGVQDHRRNIFQYPLGAALLLVVAPYFSESARRLRRLARAGGATLKNQSASASSAAPAIGRSDQASEQKS